MFESAAFTQSRRHVVLLSRSYLCCCGATMDEGMPWRNTRANRIRWRRLQKCSAFLKEARFGPLKCYYCGLGPLIVVHWRDRSGQSHPMKATVDHFIPLNGGGWDRYSNMIVSCVPCNQRKGSSLPDSSPHAWTYDGDTDKPDESTAEADVCSGILVILMVIVIFSFIAS